MSSSLLQVVPNLLQQTRNKQCENNLLTTCEQTCYNLFAVFARVVHHRWRTVLSITPKFSLFLDRYKNLPEEENQISFVNTQLDLLYFFTVSIDEIKNETDPLSPCFLFITNSTNYLAAILQDWSEQPVS